MKLRRARQGLVVAAALVVASCSSSDGVTYLDVSLAPGTMVPRPGAQALPELSWKPGVPIGHFRIAEDKDSHPSSWTCDSAGTPESRLSSPITFGLIPKGPDGRRWHCEGLPELRPENKYRVTLGDFPRSTTDNVQLRGEPVFGGLTAAVPPDTLLEESFEQGWSTAASGARPWFDGSIGAGDAPPGDLADVTASLTEARTGTTAIRICARQDSGTITVTGGVHAAPGRYSLEAWVRAADGQPAPADWSLEIFHGGTRERHQAALTTRYALVTMTVDIPGDNFTFSVGGGAAMAGACLVVDDVKLTRE